MKKPNTKNRVVTLSVVLATYNEAANIERCLTAIRDIADEIVVVDGTSSDATQQLARSFGARVINTTNKPIFHINKQLAMDAAQGKLVLQLDADEVVDEELHTFISQLKQQLIKDEYDVQQQPVAWWIKRKNLFLGRFLQKGGQYPDPVIRLYINGHAQLPQKDVHEQMTVTGMTATASGHLIHYSNPTFADYLRKWNAYSSLAAQELVTRNAQLTVSTVIQYLLVKPISTFGALYIRHKGFVDGFPGFVFALMSGLLHVVTVLKAWELVHQQEFSST